MQNYKIKSIYVLVLSIILICLYVFFVNLNNFSLVYGQNNLSKPEITKIVPRGDENTSTSTPTSGNIQLNKLSGQADDTITVVANNFGSNVFVRVVILNQSSNGTIEPDCESIKNNNNNSIVTAGHTNNSGRISLLFDVKHDHFKTNKKSYICAYYDKTMSNVVEFEIKPSAKYDIEKASDGSKIKITTYSFYGSVDSISINNKYTRNKTSSDNLTDVVEKGQGHIYTYSFTLPDDLPDDLHIILRRGKSRVDINFKLSEVVDTSSNATVTNGNIQLNKYSGQADDTITITATDFGSDVFIKVFILNQSSNPTAVPDCGLIKTKNNSIIAGYTNNLGQIFLLFDVNHSDFQTNKKSYICAYDGKTMSNVVEFKIEPSAEYDIEKTSDGNKINITTYAFYGFVDSISINNKYTQNKTRSDNLTVNEIDKGYSDIYSFILPDDLPDDIYIILRRGNYRVDINFKLSEVIAQTTPGNASNTGDTNITLSKINGISGEKIKWSGSGFLNTSKIELFALNQTDEPNCNNIIDKGVKISAAQSNHIGIVDTYFKVNKDNFKTGSIGYICAKNKALMSNVLEFEILPSIEFNTQHISSGQEVIFTAYNFYGPIDTIVINDQQEWNDSPNDDFDVIVNKDTYKFIMPSNLIGSISIELFKDYHNIKHDIMIVEPIIRVSKQNVILNELITLRGESFPVNTYIDSNNITINKHAIVIPESYLEDSCIGGIKECIKIDELGQFDISVRIWPQNNDRVFSYGTNSINVSTVNKSSAKAVIKIARPEITVASHTVSQLGDLIVEGENWPIETYNDQQDNEVVIKLNDNSFHTNIDDAGKFVYNIKLNNQFIIDKTYSISATHHKNKQINHKDEFTVSHISLSIYPLKVAPGGYLTITITGMKEYSYIDYVKISNRNTSFKSTYTDGNGNAVIEDVFIRDLSPGIYPVEVKIRDTIGVSSVEVLSYIDNISTQMIGSDGVLPDALGEYKNKIKTIFHFNKLSKEWTFYDTREGIEQYSTLKLLKDGEAYWISVTESISNVTLNNKISQFTCANNNCWNILIW